MKTKERPDITALKKRIKVAMAAKHEAAKVDADMATIPTEEELDELVPGSAAVLNAVKASMVRYPMSKRPGVQMLPRELQMQQWKKEMRGGVLGISKIRQRYKCVFENVYLGMFDSAVAAARAYNRSAAEKYGEMAVLCDLDAAATLDKKNGTFLR